MVVRLAAAHADLDGMRVLQRRGQLGGWVRRELRLPEMLEARLLGALERELGTEVVAGDVASPVRRGGEGPPAAQPTPRTRDRRPGTTAPGGVAGKTGPPNQASLAGDLLANAKEKYEDGQEMIEKGQEASSGLVELWKELDGKFNVMGKAVEGVKSVRMVKEVCETLGGLGSAALTALEKAPFVGSIAVIASGIVGALVEASEVRANCQDLDVLVMRAIQITLEAQAGLSRCTGALEELEDALGEARGLVDEVNKRGGLGRLFRGGADNRKVAESRERIEKAMNEVSAAASVETLNEVSGGGG